ncbi:MAG: glycerol-3-phosphate dehydrogenase/oxidase [Gaiellales bacterium]
MRSEPAPRARADVLAALGEGRFDLVVVGAGAIGAATAWAAARAGARVAVIDRGDLAAATSSASTKLLHGGLRYLAMGDVGLVREAHRERWRNATSIAPHLVDPLAFIVPLHGTSRREALRLRAGVGVYGALSRWRDGRSGRIDLAAAGRLAPGLATDRLTGALVYHDHRTDDARLALAAFDAAAELGAIVANHVEVTGLRTLAGQICGVEAVDRLTGAPVEIDAATVVNASGPWIDEIRRLENARAEPSVRLSKGAHLLLDVDRPWRAAVTTPLAGGRVAFAIPWRDMLLLGTTDAPYDGDPAEVQAEHGDQEQILAEAAIALAAEAIDPARVRTRFAGLRVLPLGDGSTSSSRRETVMTRGTRGMLSVAGGKLTTWLAIGDAVAHEAIGDAGFLPVPAGPVPSAVDPIAFAGELAQRFPAVPDELRTRLLRRYGRAAADILAAAGDAPATLPGADVLVAEVEHVVAREWALDADDAIRRTGLWVRGPVGEETRAACAAASPAG